MTNLIFMARGSRVTEITSGEEFEECYRRLALVCGLEYRLLVIPSMSTLTEKCTNFAR